MKSGYCITLHSERESPDEPTLYSFINEMFQQQRTISRQIELILKAVAMNQKTLSILEGKIDQILKQNSKPKPYIERGYRS